MSLLQALLLAPVVHCALSFGLDLNSVIADLSETLTNYPALATDVLSSVSSLPRLDVHRDDLICKGCDGKEQPLEKCCCCRYTPKWAGMEKNIQIEFFSVQGKSLALPFAEVVNGTVYKIEMHDTEMGEIPSNICNWDHDERLIIDFSEIVKGYEQFWNKIVKIDLDNNKIRKIPDLTCLSSLDTLSLRNNRIRHLSNSSFYNLTHLRVLTLDRNMISTMDPSVIANPYLHLRFVGMQNNQLDEIDVTNCMSLYPFCSIDYSDNNISVLTNLNNFKLDTSVTYGPGYVSFQRNSFRTFPDLVTLLNLGSVQELGKFLEFGFDVRGVPMRCDGRIEPYLEVAMEIGLEESFWRNYLDVRCDSPESLQGRMIKDIELDELVTDYICYQDCACQDRPSQNYVYTDCYGRHITDMAKGELPNPRCCDEIHLNLSNNDIQVIKNITNLENVTELYLDNNDVVEITVDAAFKVENVDTLELSNNSRLNALPEQFRYLNICNVGLDNIILDCDCQSLWVSDWSRKYDCNGNNTAFQCRVPSNGLMPAGSLQQDMLDCKIEDIFYRKIIFALAMMFLLILMVACITYQLRYEILVIILRLRKMKRNEVVPLFTYDAYLSFDEENDNLRRWVKTELIPQLAERGYKNFLTYRDLDFGAVRDNVTIDVLTKTRNFLAILSDSYIDPDGMSWTTLEWKHGWHRFKDNKLQNIVLVNFDHVSSFSVDQPEIKAFLRVGGQVDFSNHRRDIIDEISMKLGPPLQKQMPKEKAFENRKVNFNVSQLFLGDADAKRDFVCGEFPIELIEKEAN